MNETNKRKEREVNVWNYTDEKDTHEIQNQLKNANWVCKERSWKKERRICRLLKRRAEVPGGLVVGGAFVEVGGVCVGWEGLTEGRVAPHIWPECSYKRPSSFRRSATSCLSAPFSFSRNPARMAIWFSFSRRASRERLAAKLFFLRRAQYLSSCVEMEREKQMKNELSVWNFRWWQNSVKYSIPQKFFKNKKKTWINSNTNSIGVFF